MKKILSTSLITMALGLSLAAKAQINVDLEEACNSDPDVLDSIVAVIQADSSVENILSSQELEQVNAVLNDEANQSGTVSDKVKSVLELCSEGRIFQERYSNIINPR